MTLNLPSLAINLLFFIFERYESSTSLQVISDLVLFILEYSLNAPTEDYIFDVLLLWFETKSFISSFCSDYDIASLNSVLRNIFETK